MHVLELRAGLNYFFALQREVRRRRENDTTPLRCPWTGNILPQTVRDFALPFLVAARNAIISEPGRFLGDRFRPNPTMERFIRFYRSMNIETLEAWDLADFQYQSLLDYAASSWNWSSLTPQQQDALRFFQDWQLRVLSGHLGDWVSSRENADFVNFDIVNEEARAERNTALFHLTAWRSTRFLRIDPDNHEDLYLGLIRDRLQLASRVLPEGPVTIEEEISEAQESRPQTPRPQPLAAAINEIPEAFVRIERRFLTLGEGQQEGFLTHIYQPRLSNLPIIGPYRPTLALPQAPLIQPYHPDEHAREDSRREDRFAHGHVMVSVAIQMSWVIEGLPHGVRELLGMAHIPLEHLDVFLIIQDNPWEQETPLLLRAHPYLHPRAEERGAYTLSNQIQASLADVGRQFSAWESYFVHTHDGQFSPNNMRIVGNTTPESTRSIYSLITNPVLNRSALTLHVLLNDEVQNLVSVLLYNPIFDAPNLRDPLGAFFLEAENINALTRLETLPIRELRYLRGEIPRPVLNGALPVSLRRLQPQHQAALDSLIDMPFSQRRLDQIFHGAHSAGGTGTSHQLGRAVNRAGLTLVERGLGPRFACLDGLGRVQNLAPAEAEALRAIVFDLEQTLRQGLRAQSLEDSAFNTRQEFTVYFHPYAVSLRAILLNAQIHRDGGLQPDHQGMLLREIAAIWSLMRGLPEESRRDYLNDLCLELVEIQRAYNIAHFYTQFFHADERHPNEWLASHSESRGLNAEHTLAIGQIIAEYQDVLKSRIQSFETQYQALQSFLSYIHDQHESWKTEIQAREEERSSRGRRFSYSQHYVPITREMVTPIQMLLEWHQQVNAIRFPTAGIWTDDFTTDNPSCGPGTESRLINVAMLLPNFGPMVNMLSSYATQRIRSVLEGYLHNAVQCVIDQRVDVIRAELLAAFDAPEPTPEQQIALDGLFLEVAQALRQTAIRLAEQDTVLAEAIQVRHSVTMGLILDETIQCLLDSVNIHYAEPYRGETLLFTFSENEVHHDDHILNDHEQRGLYFDMVAFFRQFEEASGVEVMNDSEIDVEIDSVESDGMREPPVSP